MLTFYMYKVHYSEFHGSLLYCMCISVVDHVTSCAFCTHSTAKLQARTTAQKSKKGRKRAVGKLGSLERHHKEHRTQEEETIKAFAERTGSSKGKGTSKSVSVKQCKRQLDAQEAKACCACKYILHFRLVLFLSNNFY